MATISKSFKENQTADTASTWTVNIAGSNYSVSGTEQSITFAVPTATAKYVASKKGKCFIELNGYVYTTNASGSALSLGWLTKRKGTTASPVTMASNTLFTIPDVSSFAPSVNATNLFSSANPTIKSRTIYVSSCTVECESQNSSGDYYNRYFDDISFSPNTIGTITYACPPTLAQCSISKDTSAGYYAGLTRVTFTVPITYSASGTTGTAKYGGYIKQIDVTIGSQTKTITFTESTKPTSAQSLYINVANAGTFTPTVIVTDSRDQTVTQTLEAITVNPYNEPSVIFDIFRSDANGIKSDEGEYGLIDATITYTDGVATITEPVVTIGGTTTSNVTWYSSYNSSTGVQGLTPISNWSSLTPVNHAVTVYGLVNGSFNTEQSYLIGITDTDSLGGVSQTVTQTLSTAFYTIDFKAGGKEIAFGKPANDTLTRSQEEIGLFKCGMESHFLSTIQADDDVSVGGDISSTNATATGNLSASGNFSLGGNFTINSQKPIMFKEYDSGLMTLGAQNTTTVDATIANAPSGYIGYIIRVRIQNGTGGSNASGCNAFDYYFADSSTVRALVRNNFTAQAKVHVFFTVLWTSSNMAGSAP